MQKGRTHWRDGIAATLGVLALLVHVVLSAAHVPPSVAQAAADELCHASAGGDAPVHHQPAHDTPLPPCPICQSLQLDGAYLTPATAAFAPVLRLVGRLSPAAAEPVAGGHRLAGFQARAPPAEA